MSQPDDMETRLAAMRDRLLKMAKGMHGRPYLTAVPTPPADAPAPPPPFQEAAEEREPGQDVEETP